MRTTRARLIADQVGVQESRRSACGALARLAVALCLVQPPAYCSAQQLAAPKLVAVLPVPEPRCDMVDIQFSPDGTLLVGNQVDKLVLWDVSTRKMRKTVNPRVDVIRSMAFTPDNTSLIFVGYSSKTIKTWNLTNLKIEDHFTGPVVKVGRVAVSPDGKLLAAGEWEGNVNVWDLKTKKKIASLPGKKGGLVNVIEFSPDGKTLAVGRGTSVSPAWGEVDLYDVGGFRRRSFVALNNAVQYLTFSANGRRLATGTFETPIQLWDVASGRVTGLWASKLCDVNSVLFTSNDAVVLAAGEQPDPTDFVETLGEVRFWEAATGKELGSLSTQRGVRGASLSPDGKLLAVASGPQSPATLWDVSHFTGKTR